MAYCVDDQELYGADASASLSRVQHSVARASHAFAAHFYEVLGGTLEGAAVLSRLSPEEFAHLQSRQTQYFAMLLGPDLTQATQMTQAQRVGRIHALVGVDLPLLIASYALFEEDLQRHLMPQVATDQRESILRIMSGRILFDLQEQTKSYHRLETETAAAISQIDQLIHSTPNFADLVRMVMAAIGNLDGQLSALLGRIGAAGELQIEASQGDAGQRYHHAMMTGEVPKISVNLDSEYGRGPGAYAWRSGEIICSDAWAMEPRLKPWQKLGAALGFRSSASVSLVDQTGKSVALMAIYSAWSGFFSTLRMRNFLNHIQKSLSYAVQRHSDVPVIALRKSQEYRRLLASRRVTMLHQPIINLRDGVLTKTEDLARLIGDDGEIITPDRFLPAFGAEELFTLFQIGLAQACADCRRFEDAGIRVTVALNYPAEGVGESRYERAIFEALAAESLPPERLQLELLETREGRSNDDDRQGFLQRLRSAGVLLAQDELGSGHSSLLRLDQYGFDEVKIDQSFVRGAFHRPQRALEFILYLTRLAHAFGTPLTVEGLEHFGMIEAAAILGADHGQGYGIARPMPAAEIKGWHRRLRYEVDPRRPRTALGALAIYLLWEMLAIARSVAGEDGLNGARKSMEHFISIRGLENSELARLLQKSFSAGPAASPDVRGHVIQRFTEAWLNEAVG